MYILSFFKSLFRPRHIPPAIYFFLNMGLIFAMFAYVMPFEVYREDTTLNKVYLGLIGVAVNFAFIFVSLSPLGEWFWRITNKIEKQPEQALYSQWQQVTAVFDEVKEQAILTDRHISPNVKLYYSRTNEINAFALGHRTVIVTRGMLDVHPEYLKGVLAHEFGHIAHGDSDLKLGINVSNCFLSVFMFCVSLIANFLIGILGSFNNGITNFIALILNLIFNIIVLGLFKLWSMLGVVLINRASRRDEYAADEFASKTGYGGQLANFLYVLDGNAPKTDKFSLMFQTHPDTADRIEKLGYVLAA